MADLTKIRTTVDVQVTITLNEDELGALDALAGYSVESFLDVFYKQMGRAYLQPHEKGLRSFLAAVRGCAGLSSEAQECRDFMNLASDRRTKLAREARNR